MGLIAERGCSWQLHQSYHSWMLWRISSNPWFVHGGRCHIVKPIFALELLIKTKYERMAEWIFLLFQTFSLRNTVINSLSQIPLDFIILTVKQATLMVYSRIDRDLGQIPVPVKIGQFAKIPVPVKS